MVIDLQETIPYYMYSHLQMLQDYKDELEALERAKVNAELSGAMLEDIYEFEWEINLVLHAIGELKALAN